MKNGNIIRELLALAEEEVRQARATLDKIESNERRFAPQKLNLFQSLRRIEVAGRAGVSSLSPEAS